jgi:hypothetical protein
MCVYNSGLTASDVAKTQRLFQIIKMCEGKYEARLELEALRRDRRDMKEDRDRERARENDITTYFGSTGTGIGTFGNTHADGGGDGGDLNEYEEYE